MGNIRTIGLLGAALLIVAGGFLFPSYLLHRQQDTLFEGKLKLTEQTPVTDNEGEIITEESKLDKEELFGVAKSMVSAKDVLYHDPLPGQMNMQEAVEACLAAMHMFAEQKILPSEFLSIEEDWGTERYSNFHASLATKVYEGNPSRPVDASSSVWKIGFLADKLSVELYMEARTGQILWLRVRSDNVKNYTLVSETEKEEAYELVELGYPVGLDMGEVLAAYLEYLELDPSEASYFEVGGDFHASVAFPLEQGEGKVKAELRIGDTMGYAYLDIEVY